MRKKLIGVALFASLAMTGCGTLSDVSAEGDTNEPVFPKLEDVSFDAGSYPSIDNLRQVKTIVDRDGITRDQLYDLLGRPHFSEGFRVREWDYLFHFNTPKGKQTCQYKVLFDDDLIGRSTYWKPVNCADLIDGKPIKPFSISGDIGFAFGSGVLSTAGRGVVRDIATRIMQAPAAQKIIVSGYTDRLGDEDSNQRLSQRRAESVQNALIAEGIPAERIQALGFGEDHPVMQCDQVVRSELIACLAPNRRVDIEVQG